MSTIELTAADEARIEQFAGDLFAGCLASLELANVELGVRLGLYEALAGAGPVTAGELASSAGIQPRYAREWLEQQAVAGVVEVDDVIASPDERRFTLPNAHAHVLTDDDSEACMKPCAAVVPWLGKALDIMVEEFRRGTGAAFGLFDLHDVQAAFTRPVFVTTSPSTGSRLCPTSRRSSRAARPCASRRSAAGKVLRRSRSPGRIRTPSSTGTTSTRRRSSAPAPRPRGSVSPTACASRCATPPIRWTAATTTW